MRHICRPEVEICVMWLKWQNVAGQGRRRVGWGMGRGHPVSQSSTGMVENMYTTKMILLPSTNFN